MTTMQLKSGRWGATIDVSKGVRVTCFGANEAEAVAAARRMEELLTGKNEVTV